MTSSAQPNTAGFKVTGWVNTLGGFVARNPGLWKRLGNFETRIAADAIEDIDVERPIYVAGLARSGSTKLLEILASHPDVASHRYRDYPLVFTPYLWNRWLDKVPQRTEQAAERTHADGIKVTSESPEAFEEVLWMAYFPDIHDTTRSSVLTRDTSNPPFERFYREHIRKLLAVRKASRYIAKGNYNVSRLGYLRQIFDDARFVIPVRDPVWHIASLMKQHRLFLAGERDHPEALTHMQRVGHFEFGLDRRAINLDDDEAVADVQACWERGDDVLGWARYWALIHNHILDRLEADPDLKEAALIVRFEDLCQAPREYLQRILEHCGLPADAAFVEDAASGIHFPTYYEPGFTPAEMDIIRTETAGAARRLGYPFTPPA
nr:sulfotransferase [uncultured Halomonas sp.]